MAKRTRKYHGVKLSINDTDRGFAGVMRRIAKAASRSPELRVGVLGKEAQSTYKDGTKTVVVATAHEFGLGVPERSFLRATVSRNEKSINRNLAKAGQEVFLNRDPRPVLAKVGVWLEGKIKQTIAKGTGLKKLAQSTIDRKGSSKPLIDTGQLRNSVTSEVVK